MDHLTQVPLSLAPEMSGPGFQKACTEYAYLLNRGYPERGALKMVGDRHQLTRDQRTVLYRGISAEAGNRLRKSLLTREISGHNLVIDGYNVLFTLLSYRLGRMTFIGTDGILRDAGSLHGRLRSEDTFHACIALMSDFLAAEKPRLIELYLDSPVSHSERHAGWVRRHFLERAMPGACTVVRSADFALKNSAGAVLATSDTVIIEKALLPVADLPRMILEKKYEARFPDMRLMLESF